MKTEPSLNIECVNKESNEINGQFIGVNVIRGKIGKIPFEFPSPATTQIELEGSNRTGIPIKTNIIQYYYQNKPQNSLKKVVPSAKLQKHFEKMMKNHPNSIPDINFDYVNDYSMSYPEIEMATRIQGESEYSLFLSAVEINKNQTLESFKKQLKFLEETYPQKIICPTIDLNAIPQIFLEKLQYIIAEKYQRFNVTFGGFITRQENWLSLSREIFNKPIWCNVVNLQQRFGVFSESFASNISIAFAYGIHTISVGYPRMDFTDEAEREEKLKNPIARILNRDTLMYEKTDEYTKPQSIIQSYNNQQAEAKVMRDRIGKNFFDEYAKKDALKNHLSKIKRRI